MDGDRTLKVSVKGSRDGSWGLAQNYLKNADYHAAADAWLAKHTRKTIFCFVQFKNVPLGELQRMYLAAPGEVAGKLKTAAAGRGDTILHESHTWGPKAHAVGTTDEIPAHWRFTLDRLEELATALGEGL